MTNVVKAKQDANATSPMGQASQGIKQASRSGLDQDRSNSAIDTAGPLQVPATPVAESPATNCGTLRAEVREFAASLLATMAEDNVSRSKIREDHCQHLIADNTDAKYTQHRLTCIRRSMSDGKGDDQQSIVASIDALIARISSEPLDDTVCHPPLPTLSEDIERQQEKGDTGTLFPQTQTQRPTTAEPTEDHSPAQKNEPQGRIPISDLTISRWNRQYDIDPAEESTRSLSDEINAHGLLHPITLTVEKTIVAGAHRFLAIKLTRGPDGMLEPHEYRMRPDLHEQDPQCADVSAAENRERHTTPPYQQGLYARRLVKDEKFTRDKVAELLGLSRETTGRLINMLDYYDELPASWQEDLGKEQDCESLHKPHITISHWAKVATTVKKHGRNEPALMKLLEEAYTNGMSVQKLDEAVKALKGPAENEGEPKAGEPGDDVDEVETSVKDDAGSRLHDEALSSSDAESGSGDAGQPLNPATGTEGEADPAEGTHALQQAVELLNKVALLLRSPAPDLVPRVVSLVDEIDKRMDHPVEEHPASTAGCENKKSEVAA